MYRRYAALLLAFVAIPAFAVAPVITGATIDYSANQITINGSFGSSPAVTFNGVTLSVSSASSAVIVADLQSGLSAGTYNLSVKVANQTTEFEVAYAPPFALNSLCGLLESESETRDLIAEFAAGCYKAAFVTLNLFDGNLGGIRGADNKCQAEANAAGLPGTFRAWISNFTSGASHYPAEGYAGSYFHQGFRHTSVPYRLLVANTIANNWADLISRSSLASGLGINQFGEPIPSSPSTEVWTDTNSDGTAQTLGADCSSWTSNSSGSTGSVGESQSLGSWSSTGTTEVCSSLQHLYCFQQ